MAVHYYLFPRIHVAEFKAHAGAYIVGAPQPTSLTGMVYAAWLKLAQSSGAKLAGRPGVLYGVSEWSGFAGRSLNPRNRFGTSKADASIPAQLDERTRASATLALVMEVKLEADSPIPSASEVAEVVHCLPLQGASMFIQAAPAHSTELDELLKKVPSSTFFLVDDAQTLESDLESAPSTAEALRARIARPDNGYKPHWVPVLVGWRPLDALPRASDTPVLTEPAVGLGKFMSKGSLLTKAKDQEFPLFWKHAVVEAPSTHFVVKGFPALTQDISFF